MPLLTPNQVLAFNVKRLREQNEWSLSHLADRVNARRGTRWTKQTVLQVEKVDGHQAVGRKVSMDELVALANVFRVSVIELLLPPDTITNEATDEVEDVYVDLGPLGTTGLRNGHDRDEYAAITFHFPMSEPDLSTPSFWSNLGDQVQGERAEFLRDLNDRVGRWAQEQVRRYEEETDGDDQED